MNQVNVDEDNVIVYVNPRWYGSFYSTQDQTNAASVNKFTLNVTTASNGVSIVSNSRITIANGGVYNIQFSAQLDKTDGGDDLIDIWLMKNNANVADSNTRITLHHQDGKVVASWNWFVQANAGDYFEIAWYSADSDMFLNYIAAGTSPTRPAIPSIILTVNQVA